MIWLSRSFLCLLLVSVTFTLILGLRYDAYSTITAAAGCLDFDGKRVDVARTGTHGATIPQQSRDEILEFYFGQASEIGRDYDQFESGIHLLTAEK